MLKKLKSLFIVEEPGDQKAKKVQNDPKKSAPEAKASGPKGAAPPPIATTSKADASKGSVSEKFMDILLKSLEANNLEGFDYLEYKQTMQNLGDMDDQAKFQNAFAMAKTMGATSKHLVDTASHYLKILDQEQSKFEVALKNQQSNNITGRKQEIADLSKVVEQKEAQIEKLNEDIAKHKKAIEKKSSELDGAANKIERTKNNFAASYQLLTSQIREDVDKMKNYLK